MPFDRTPDRTEVLTRFIFSGRHFTVTPRRVKPDAVLPSRDPLETSVFRTLGLDLLDIRRHGEEVGAPSARTLKAWADLTAGAVADVGLDVRPDNVPERHAAIIGWPGEKDRQLSPAQQLSVTATLHLPV